MRYLICALLLLVPQVASALTPEEEATVERINAALDEVEARIYALHVESHEHMQTTLEQGYRDVETLQPMNRELPAAIEKVRRMKAIHPPVRYRTIQRERRT